MPDADTNAVLDVLNTMGSDDGEARAMTAIANALIACRDGHEGDDTPNAVIAAYYDAIEAVQRLAEACDY